MGDSRPKKLIERHTMERQAEKLRREVHVLRGRLYSFPRSGGGSESLELLAQKEAELRQLEEELNKLDAEPREEEPTGPVTFGRFLGPETTKLRVKPTLHLQPLPTGVYHLLDPEDPEVNALLSVVVGNEDREIRRICVKATLENLSTTAVRTVEIKPRKEAIIKLLPTLIPERARQITEVQRATLHLIVEDLDGKLESHDTFSIVCMARTSSFNAVQDPGSGQLVDLSHYYGAWVTPHIEPVQQIVRRASDLMAQGSMVGYQQDPDLVGGQVRALFEALKEVGITYVHSVIDYGAPVGHSTQRTRLPRESLATKSANCIDGTVLMASLLEAASLNAAIVLVPGHAIVAWQSWDDEDAAWHYLETTMIGTSTFEEACQAGEKLMENYQKYHPGGVKVHKIDDLRKKNIWPME